MERGFPNKKFTFLEILWQVFPYGEKRASCMFHLIYKVHVNHLERNSAPDNVG